MAGSVVSEPESGAEAVAPPGGLETLERAPSRPDGDGAGRDEVARVAAAERRYVRSPVFLGRLLLAAVAAVVLATLPDVFDLAVAGLRGDLAELVQGAPGSIAGLTDAVAIAAGLLVAAGFLIAAALRRDLRSAGLVLAAAAASVTVVVLYERWEGLETNHVHVAVIAALTGAAAVLATQAGPRHEGLRRLGWIAVVLAALLGAPWDNVGVPGRLEAVAAGVVLGAGLALAIGTETLAATASTLRAALAVARIPAVTVTRHGGDARGSQPWDVELETGRALFVKTYSEEERSADLLFRTWRFLGLRVPDRRPESSLRAAVEHEAFLSTRAGLVGANAPRFIAMAPIDDGGIFAAYAQVDGRTFAEAGEELTEVTLRSTWSMVIALHRAGIAHRDLRVANLMVDDRDEPWIVDFAFGQMAASDEQMRMDTVELLASLSTAVGIERAVGSALTVAGREELIDALPYLQPLATSTATRHALGKRGFADLRTAVREATGAPEPDLPPLATIRPKTVLSVIAFGLAVWVLLSQLGNTGDLVERLGDASWGWVGVAIVASSCTYVGAAMSITGSVPSAVPFGSAFGSQLASSFVNRVTPAQVGGAVLNVRWLTKEGNDSATATTAVGVNALSGAVVHIVLMLVAVIWAGTNGLSGVQLPEAKTFIIVATVLLMVLAAGWGLPPLRKTFTRKVRPRLLQSWRSVVALSRQPQKIALAFGGSLIVTVSYLVALTAALHAFGASPALSTIAVVYLAGSALASAAPTPSGLGATEAILAAGFIAAGVDQPVAVASVLLFRAVTFWLPIVPGWIAFVVLQRTDRI